MTTELYWLTLTVLLTSLIWVPYILDRLFCNGNSPIAVLANRGSDNLSKNAWAIRLMAAHKNAVENLVVFAPLVLVLHQVGISTNLTINACIIYFFARLAHILVYTFGIPFLRTIAFAVGFFCQLALALTLLGII